MTHDDDAVQLDMLDGPGMVRHDALDTSAEAGAEIPNLTGLYARILEAMGLYRFTAEELSDYTRIKGDTLRPRLLELAGKAANRPQFKERPLIERTELKAKTRSGHMAHTWILTADGRRALMAHKAKKEAA